MLAPSEPTPPGDGAVAPELAEVGAYATEREAFEHGLVILAMGRPCWITPREMNHRLLVEPHALDEVHRQLRCFDRESRHWPPAAFTLGASGKIDWTLPLLWSLLNVAVFWGEAAHPNWIERGSVDGAALFRQHEAWRAVTALFLHADVAHLLANAVAGIFVFAAVTSAFGRRRGWLLLGLTSVAANAALGALRYSSPIQSIGASTAVFAGVGSLTGRALRLALAATPRRWRLAVAPLAAGAGLLALYGAGGWQVDVLAHALGFATGMVGGWLALRVPGTAHGTASA